MTDRLEQLLRQARVEALREVRPPGVDHVRRTARRRHRVVTGIGAAVAVAVVMSGIAVAGDRRPEGTVPVTAGTPVPSASALEVNPSLSPSLAAASAALGEPGTTPWVMATAGTVSRSYENHVNDIPAGDYDLFLYCAGAGTVDAVVKSDRTGDVKLAAGSVTCGPEPGSTRLRLRQPADGYLRVFLSGDARASARSAFSFKFVRVARAAEAGPQTTTNAARAAEAGPQTTTNAARAADRLTAAGVARPAEVTTERNRTVEERRPPGHYLVSFACEGPGRLSFTVRSADVLRDGTVATNGRVAKSVVHECDSAANLTKDLAVSMSTGAALTITTEADDVARGRAGWAYAIRTA